MRLEDYLDRDWTTKGEWLDQGKEMPIVGRHIGYRCDSCKWDTVETFIAWLVSISYGLAHLHLDEDNAVPYIIAQVEDLNATHLRLLPGTEHKSHQEQYLANLTMHLRESLSNHLTDWLQGS